MGNILKTNRDTSPWPFFVNKEKGKET